jgi:O-antigen/teichoic acid export membrane protein
MPWAAKHLAEQGLIPFKRSIVEITSLMTALAGAYALILAFSAAPLMQVLYDGKYQGFVWLVPWFAMSFLTTSFAGGYGLGLKVAQATRAIFVVTCIGAGTTIFVGSMLVRLLGLEGVALGALLSNTSEALVIVWCWRRLVWQKSSELNRYNPRAYTLDKGTKHGSHSI